MYTIEVENLRKAYQKGVKRVEALKGVSFKVKKNEIFGLLGPNGAGKTSTINILLGILTHDSGNIKILNKDPDEVKHQINYASAYAWLSGITKVDENLKVYGKIYNVKNIKERIDHLLDIFEISHLRRKKAYALSSGEQTRLNLCKGLINNPRVLLLDECTVGLDPDIAEKTRRIIKKQQSEYGTSILFTSHNMVEVEELCNRIAFLHQGKIIKLGTPKQLNKLIKKQIVKLDFFSSSKSLINYFKKTDHNIINLTKNHAEIELDFAENKLHQLIQPLFKKGFQIKDIHIEKPNLEKVFLKMARK
ncbi:ABC transporter ATP-binding protein [Nanoarchaeota archaeon]